MSNRLEGKVALVTACTRGIGRAIADLFVDEGREGLLCLPQYGDR